MPYCGPCLLERFALVDRRGWARTVTSLGAVEDLDHASTHPVNPELPHDPRSRR